MSRKWQALSGDLCPTKIHQPLSHFQEATLRVAWSPCSEQGQKGFGTEAQCGGRGQTQPVSFPREGERMADHLGLLGEAFVVLSVVTMQVKEPYDFKTRLILVPGSEQMTK